MEATELTEAVEALCDSAFAEPDEGVALFAFFTRDEKRSLEPHEVIERLADGRGAYLVELVYDEELELVERGEGRVIRAEAELLKFARRKLKVFRKGSGSDGFETGRSPSIGGSAGAALAADKDGRPAPQTSIPWHPSSIALPTKKGGAKGRTKKS